MTTLANKLIATFESLDAADRQEVAVEILRRATGLGEFPDDALEQVADELFLSYEAEEGESDTKPR